MWLYVFNYFYWWWAAIKTAAKDEFDIVCADRLSCWCHSMIADFMIDYKKQILITDVKMNQHYIICQILSQKWEHLKRVWLFWTHQFIKNQISQQKDEDISDNDSVWVHSVSNFIWNHYLINIYETIMIDVLHQLFKSTVIYLIHWLEQLIEKSITVTRKKKDVRHKISNASEIT